MKAKNSPIKLCGEHLFPWLFLRVFNILILLGPKQQRKFKRLMLHRIKWSEGQKHTKDEGKFKWLY